MGRHGDIGDVERDVKPRPSIPSQVLGPPFFSSSLPVLQSRHQFVTPRPEKFEVCPDEGHKKSEALFATLRKPTAWLSPGNRTPEHAPCLSKSEAIGNKQQSFQDHASTQNREVVVSPSRATARREARPLPGKDMFVLRPRLKI